MQKSRFIRNAKTYAWSYALLAPMVILTSCFVVYPIFDSFRMAFYNWDGFGQATQWVGMRHFINVANDPFFWNAFRHSVLYTCLLVPIQLSLALVIAVILSQLNLKGFMLYRAIFFMPVVTSAAIVGIVMSLLMGNFSAQISQPLIALHILSNPINLLDNPQLALYVVIAVGIWHSLGINMVYFLAALQGVAPELYDAAQVDGATAVQRFIHVTLPSIRSVGVVIVFLSILGSLGVFDLVITLTNGGPYYSSDVVSTYIYSYAFTSTRGGGQANYGVASAAAIFMGILVMGVTVAQLFAVRVAKRNEGSKV